VTKKDEFVNAFKKATKSDPATIDQRDPNQVKQFVKNLTTYGLYPLFDEAVNEALTEYGKQDDAMMGLGSLFGNI